MFLTGRQLFSISQVEESQQLTEIDKKESDAAVFKEIYKKGIWGVGSGPGSYRRNTVEYRKLLQDIFDDDRFVDFNHLLIWAVAIFRLWN